MAKADTQISADINQQRKDFRVKLLSNFLLIGLFSAVLQLVINIFDDTAISIITEVVFASILSLLYILNRKGYHDFSQTATFVVINFALFFSFRFEPTSGIQYYYFPMVLLAFVLHDSKDWVKAGLFAILPIILFIINTYEHFQVDAYLKDRDLLSISMNFATAAIVSTLAIIYFIRSNVTNEDSLIKANDEISAVSQELKVNNEILAKTNDELDKFMYSSSHDLRAPLASILGLVNLAKLEPIEKHSDYIEMIRDRVIGLDYFIKDIIDFSKNSHTDIRYEIIDVEDLIDLCVEHNRYLPGADKVELSVNIETSKIKSDHYRLSSILTTLIANAIKYHNLDQEKPMLWVEVKGDNPITFSVRDNGCGINKKVRPQIFEMFYRGHEKSNGSGLGLYIAREMLNSLRGTFEVKTEEGKGSTFKFHLPVPANPSV